MTYIVSDGVLNCTPTCGHVPVNDSCGCCHKARTEI